MESANKLASRQQEIADAIKKSYTNFKKDSAARKTQTYIKKRLSDLEQLWLKAESIDAEIKDLQVPEHNYHKTNFYEKMQDVYLEFRDNLMELQDQLTKAAEEASEAASKAQKQAQQIKVQELKIHRMEAKLDQICQKLTGMQPKAYYEVSRHNIMDQWKSVMEQDEKIQINEENFQDDYFKNQLLGKIEEKYQQVLIQLEEKLQNNPSNNTARNCNIPLPQIKLPMFEGRYEEWVTFQELFLQIIHLNDTLTKTEKMQYLQSYVKGEAKKVIQHLQITEANYDTAWGLLQSRYNNKRLILFKLLDKILDLPVINQESAEKIKQLHDTSVECLQAIKNLGIDTSSWGPMIIRILTRKWDGETNKLYEQSIKAPHEVPELQSVMGFLVTRFQSLEAITESRKKTNNENPASQGLPQQRNGQTCKYCQQQHFIGVCSEFSALTVAERAQALKERKLCNHCMKHDASKRCYAIPRCNICKKSHNTLMHREQKVQPQKETDKASSHIGTVAQEMVAQEEKTIVLSNHVGENQMDVLLATAIVKVKTMTGSQEMLRVLVDPGSQASFITEEAAQVLALPKQKIRAEITGLGKAEPKVSKAKIEVEIKPRFPSNFKLTTELMVLATLTQTLPREELKDVNQKQWQNRLLADPTFNKPGPIDILLGAEVYGEILLQGMEKTENNLLGQNTELGWVLSGSFKKQNKSNVKIVSMVTQVEEDQQLTKFWEIEEVPENPKKSEDALMCEEHYEQNHHRNMDGTYTVKIPFKDGKVNLGESKPRALARLLQIERRFSKNEKLGEEYKKFMKEYIDLGHMKKVHQSQDNESVYYIPHQAIFKESTTTKLRVVFDASSKTSNGVSLNDTMLTGPRLQQELFDIVLRWRKHRIAFTADIEKMYRQIKVAEEDQRYQKILWRFDPTEPIQEYNLTTVTYGTTAAPYLAIKTLQQLAKDERERFPRASYITMTDFYVDDLMSGTNTVEQALQLQEEINAMLKLGGFNLRKWASNSKELLKALPQDYQDQSSIQLSEDGTRKSLGIYWNPGEDTFKFKVDKTDNAPTTKRYILTEIAKLFDPLGWLAPVIIQAKMLMQELWMQQLEWDQPVPAQVQQTWVKFYNELPAIEDIKIPRWIQYDEQFQVELHGFADASEKAYGAVIYAKTTSCSGETRVSLLVAKSKVAPVKMKKTLPRLELCAAVLLARLMQRTRTAINMEDVPIHTWTDSMITLSWIRGDPGRWKTFVANRVAEIVQTIPIRCWNHVGTKDNPADVISRGISPTQLQTHPLWWSGPQWLKEGREWPLVEVKPTIEEVKTCHQVTVEENPGNFMDRFSSLTKMTRVIAYCNRFARKCRKITQQNGSLSTKELDSALKQTVRILQQTELKNEVMLLKEKKQVDKRSKICSLSPFMDEDGIVRVGGRLTHSTLPYNNKHPIIIPYGSHLAQMIIQDAHQQTLHGGSQMTLAYIRRKFWIINGKRAVRSIINKCVTCVRYKAQTAQQIMGNLPVARVTQSNPFTHTGVDYAGPIQIRTTKGRGHKAYKGYIAVFVCLATKAIHLEAVSDMSSIAFLAALKRFVSRRGRCNHLYSDNGTTFVGANKELQREVNRMVKNQEIEDHLATNGIQWHYIPPAAPHMGGLWEAGVKSVKHHLKRVIGDSTLTFEEMSTLLCQIEACLNSRPLCPLSDDVNEMLALTPGHFLIGKALINPPDPVTMDIDTNVTNRWKLVNKARRDFWNSWSTEYLSRLQQRNKWKVRQENVQIGDLVLLKEEINPSQWPLARVTQVYPAPDGTVRVVSIKQANGSILKRPITKVVPLPTMEIAETKDEDVKVTINANMCLVNQNKVTHEHKQHNATKRAIETAFLVSTKRAIGTALVVWLLLLMSCTNVLGEDTYTIKHPEPGLYVEHIGFAKIERGTFRIEVRFPKRRLKEEEDMVNRTVSSLQEFCNQMKELSDLSQCKTLAHHIVEQQEHLWWTIRSINGIVLRKRRGLLGNLMTSIFGVNDEVYKDIDELEANQEELIKTSNHQTRILVSALASVNDTEIRIANQLNRFRDKLNQGLEAINTMKKWYRTVDENALNIHMLNAYQVVSNYIQEVQQLYSKLLNVHVKEGHLYDFITPAHVAKVIDSANMKLPSGIAVLSHPILKTKVEHREEEIYIYGYFMVVELTEYTVIKTTPVPLKVENGSYWTLEVPSEVLAINYNSQTYFELSKEEFEQSIFLPKNKVLCAPAVVRSIENSPNCIIDEIYQRMDRTRCQVKREPIRSIIWKQLYMTNTWMFVTSKPTKVAITCNGQREDVMLNITGIIQISQKCVIQTKQSILTPKMKSTVPVMVGFNKPVDIKVNASTYHSTAYQDIAKEPVFKVSDQLGAVINDERHLQLEIQDEIWKKVRHHSITTSTTVIGVTLIGGIVGWGIYLWWIRKRATPESIPSEEAERQPINQIQTTVQSIQRQPIIRIPRKNESIEMQPIYSEVTHNQLQDSSGIVRAANMFIQE